MKKNIWRYRAAACSMALLMAGWNPAAAYATTVGTTAGAEQESSAQEEGQEGTEQSGVTEEAIDAYFDGTVLVGDSVMLGYRNYAQRRQDTFLSRIGFLAAGSFSVENSLWPVNAKSVHPIYQGQKRLVWESISMMQAKRVFLFFGLNDLNINGLEGTCAKYQELINQIKQLSPDTEIHIISMTYTLAGKGKGKLNNDSIRQFNEMLKQMCLANYWGYVDITTALADANGDLAAPYCSDGFVHQTPAAYDVWTQVLRNYARSQLDGTTQFPLSAAEDVVEEPETTAGRTEIGPGVGLETKEAEPETTAADPAETEPESTISE